MAENLVIHSCPSMGPNGGSVAMDLGTSYMAGKAVAQPDKKGAIANNPVVKDISDDIPVIPVPEFIDPRFRENKPNSLVFSH
jgi:hypothetical protein